MMAGMTLVFTHFLKEFLEAFLAIFIHFTLKVGSGPHDNFNIDRVTRRRDSDDEPNILVAILSELAAIVVV